MSERAFHARAERLAAQFCARYGVTTAWSDEQINRALADHNLPALSMMPAEPRGMMAEQYPQVGPLDAVEAHRWQRTNAMHLLAHVMLGHPEPRCDGCRAWGAPADAGGPR